MKYPLAAFGVIAIVITGFVLLFTNYNQSASEQLTEVITEKTIDDCYDQTMTSWFLEFTASQENGATMDEADENASKKALSNYGECLAER